LASKVAELRLKQWPVYSVGLSNFKKVATFKGILPMVFIPTGELQHLPFSYLKKKRSGIFVFLDLMDLVEHRCNPWFVSNSERTAHVGFCLRDYYNNYIIFDLNMFNNNFEEFFSTQRTRYSNN
jgi:hypothetical protein